MVDTATIIRVMTRMEETKEVMENTRTMTTMDATMGITMVRIIITMQERKTLVTYNASSPSRWDIIRLNVRKGRLKKLANPTLSRRDT